MTATSDVSLSLCAAVCLSKAGYNVYRGSRCHITHTHTHTHTAGLCGLFFCGVCVLSCVSLLRSGLCAILKCSPAVSVVVYVSGTSLIHTSVNPNHRHGTLGRLTLQSARPRCQPAPLIISGRSNEARMSAKGFGACRPSCLAELHHLAIGHLMSPALAVSGVHLTAGRSPRRRRTPARQLPQPARQCPEAAAGGLGGAMPAQGSRRTRGSAPWSSRPRG